jgi:chromosome segregation ATPase
VPPPPPPKFSSFEDVGRWAEEHENLHKRERHEQREEFGTMLKAATSHIDGVAKKLTDEGAERSRKLEEIDRRIRRGNRYLKEAATERGRRAQRELDEEQRRKDRAALWAQAFRWGKWILLPIALAVVAWLAKR